MDLRQEKVLQEFLMDIDILGQLDEWTNKFNLFDVLKITNAEIRHSNILGWLLDPNENHKLGDSFIRAFISKIIQNKKMEPGESIDLLMQDYYSYSVLREHNHMDLILLSRQAKTAYIIENKIWSGESSHQLKDYYKKSQEEYVGYKIIYAFLTPDGHEASDADNWVSISYEEIIPILENVTRASNVSNEVKILVDNYIEAVRRNIMPENDERLEKICNDIYNKHREALNLIFKTVNMNKTIESEVICRVLNEYSQEGKLIYHDDNTLHFFTKRMNDFLPALEKENGSWGTNWVYYYWFEYYGERLIIHLELGGWGVSDDSETFSRMKQLIQCSKLLGNRVSSAIPFRYKRIYTKYLSISPDDYDSIEKQTKKLVDSVLTFENQLFEKIEDLNKQK